MPTDLKVLLSDDLSVNELAMYYLPSSWKTPSFTILNDLNTAPSSNMECESGGMDPENDNNIMKNLTMILHFVLSPDRRH